MVDIHLDQDSIIVWMIEDNDSLRIAIVDILNQANDISCPVHQSSMEQVLPLLKPKNLQDPAVVVIDLGLPGMNGLEGIALLKERFPNCEILVFTVEEDSEKIYAAIKSGASGYLLKTESMNRIPNAIREACGGGGPMSAAAGRKLMESVRSSSQPKFDYGLSRRELEVLKLMTEGLGKKEVADKLDLSYHTIDCYVRGFYKKLKVNTIHGAVGKALKERLLKD